MQTYAVQKGMSALPQKADIIIPVLATLYAKRPRIWERFYTP
jgi:hypothetical protein